MEPMVRHRLQGNCLPIWARVVPMLLLRKQSPSGKVITARQITEVKLNLRSIMVRSNRLEELELAPVQLRSFRQRRRIRTNLNLIKTWSRSKMKKLKNKKVLLVNNKILLTMQLANLKKPLRNLTSWLRAKIIKSRSWRRK